MFNLGDRVKLQDADDIGIVIGYGNRIVKNKCLKTVKVKIISSTLMKKATVKDLDYKWLPCPEDYRLSFPNPLARHLTVKPI